MDILFSDVLVITMDEQNAFSGDPASSAAPVLFNGYVGVSGQKITYVGKERPKEFAARTINGNRKLLMPGLINAHTHMPMTLLRGYADDYRLQEWLFDHIFPAESKLDERCVSSGTLLALAECIRFGIVSCTDMYFNLRQIAEAVLQAGTKANITNAVLCLDMENYDFEKDRGIMQVKEMLRQFGGKYSSGAGNSRVIVDAGIHGEYTSGPAAWEKCVAFAAENDLRLHLHLSETEFEHNECVKRYGKTPTEILHQYGVFSRKTTAAHCCWLTENDMDILAANSATAAHCPVSNLKLSSGIAAAAKMQKRGVNVALGTDGVCSNNNHDLFEEIKTSALLQKYISGDPSVMPAYQAIKMATLNGARAQGRENETGKIAAGFDADIILLNLDAPHLFPLNDPCALVAYSAKGSDVCLTMVQGKILYENGEHKTIDLEKIRYEVDNYVVKRLGK